MDRRRKRWLRAGWKNSVMVSGLAAGIYVAGLGRIEGYIRTENARMVQNSITRACVQCYAIEGRYPPDIGYLEEYYGIQADRERYYVFYDGFASNLMPDIVVLPADEKERRKSRYKYTESFGK